MLFDFPVVNPGATVTELFDSTTAVGLYALTWDTSAPSGFINSGDFVLSAEWWDGDPSSGGTYLATAPEISASYSVTANAPTTATPEPSTLSMVLIALAAIGCLAPRVVRCKLSIAANRGR